MKRIISMIVVIGACLLSGPADLFGQHTLSGVVKDASNGEVLIGANVIIQGTQVGTITDVNGHFTLIAQTDTGRIVFSFVGYLTQDKKFYGDQVINAELLPDMESLEEVVVVAYGTQKKSHLTGAVSSLKNDGLDEIAVSRADQALQGKLAGVQIKNLNPEAGAAPAIRVRGMGSISASSDPLIVIDGYPMPAGEDAFSMISMGDVESIEVLKDAASSALYGSRAASGVILITTKTGSAKKTKYNFKMYSGISKPLKLPEMMGIEEYVELLYQEAELRMTDPAVDGVPTSTMAYNLTTNPERTGYLISKYIVDQPTNWVDEALRDHGSINSYQLSASGGNERNQFYISGSYNSEDGIMERSSYSKFSFRTKADFKLSDRVKVGVNISPTYSTRERPQGNLTDYIRFHSWMPVYHNEATAALTGSTVGEYAQVNDFGGITLSGIGVDGTVWNMVGENPWTSSNQTPVSRRERTSRLDDTYRLQSNAYLSWEILTGLQFTTSLGAYFSYNEYNMKEQTSAASEGAVNQLSREMTVFSDLLMENILSYDKSIGDHEINAILGFTAQQTNNKFNKIVAQGFPDEERMSFNMASVFVKEGVNGTYSYYYPESLVSALGRFTYSFRGKYMASVAVRADGSSKFAPGNQWGTFPSASVGWRVSEEDFLKNSRTVSNLKIRASYGLTGNNDISRDESDRYAYMNTVTTIDYSLGTGTGSLFTGMSSTGASLGNPALSWEQLEELNIGIDLGLLKNRYNISVELYNSNSLQLLLKQPAMYITGHASAWNNIGEVNNKGVEFEIKANVISTGDFSWIINGNLSKNKNTLLNYGNLDKEDRYGERSEIYRAEVGKEAIQYFGYKSEGVWTSFEEVNEAISDTSFTYSVFAPVIGGLKIANTDGNDSINADDRVVLGSPYPDFVWALTNTFRYKSFDLSFLFQGSQGGELINGNAYYNEQLRMNKAYTENRFVSPMYPGDGKTVYSTNTSGGNLMLTDYVIEDASYIALREISLGYTLPGSITKVLHLNNLRAYASATNLIYLMGSDYRGINPEARTTTTTNGADYSDPLRDGYQRGAFPLNRTFIFGLDITF